MKLSNRKVRLCQQTIKNLIQVMETCTPIEFLTILYSQEEQDVEDVLTFITTIAATEEFVNQEEESFQDCKVYTPDC
jgi:hypothetical protein